MDSFFSSWGILLPILIVIATAFFVLILDLFLSDESVESRAKNKAWAGHLSLVGLILALTTIALMSWKPVTILGGSLGLDTLGFLLITVLLSSTIIVIMLAPATLLKIKSSINPIKPKTLRDLPEFFAVLLFTLSGMMLLVCARDLVTLYVSLELATIPLFALTAWSKTDFSGEAAFKYLVMGALGSGLLLYGLGFVYALSGNFDLSAIAHSIRTITVGSEPILFFAAALITAGVGFKLTLFPFHMWAPDAYQEAPTTITAFLSVASKTTGLILAVQVILKLFAGLMDSWTLYIAVMATLTMTLGNIVAIRQNNIKRFMAFSSISQAGYLLMGFLSTKPDGISSLVFYMLVYAATNLAAFGVIIIHVDQSGQEDISSLKGMSRTNPLLALILMIALFGLAGIPPLAGFVGKFFLFNVAAQKGLYWLVAVAALNSTASLYYYLRLVRQMYIEDPPSEITPLQIPFVSGLALGITTVASLCLGLLPWFFESIQAAGTDWIKQYL